MNTNNHTAEAEANPNYEAEVRARCPKWMKQGVKAVAGERVLEEADILREAVNEYLDRRGIKNPALVPQA